MRETRKRTAALVFLVASLSLAVSVPLWAQQALPVQDNGQPQAGAPNPGAPNGQQQPLQQLPPDTIRPNYVLGPNDQIQFGRPRPRKSITGRFGSMATETSICLWSAVSTPLGCRCRNWKRIWSSACANTSANLRFSSPSCNPQASRCSSGPVCQTRGLSAAGQPHADGNVRDGRGLQLNADRHIKITRQEEYGQIPLPDAVFDPEKKVSTVEISMGSLRQSMNPEEKSAATLRPGLGRPRREGVRERRGHQDRRHRTRRARLHFGPSGPHASRRIHSRRQEEQGAHTASG